MSMFILIVILIYPILQVPLMVFTGSLTAACWIDMIFGKKPVLRHNPENGLYLIVLLFIQSVYMLVFILKEILEV